MTSTPDRAIVARSGGRFRRGIKAAWIVAGAIGPEIWKAGRGRISVARETTPAGTEYDLYEHRAPRRSVVLVHGMHLLGERHPDLVRLARTLAASGLRVAAVELPGLKDCREDLRDLDVLRDAVQTLHTAPGDPVGAVAFSFGGGLTLTAAAGAAVGVRIDPIILFGAPHSFDELASGILAPASGEPRNEDEWKADCYVRLVTVYRALSRRTEEQARRQRLAEILRAYRPTVERLRAAYDRDVLPLEPLSELGPVWDETICRALSPRGKLSGLPGRVILFHGDRDRVVPPSHSERIHAELSARGIPGGQEILVTPVLSHAGARTFWRVSDVCRLFAMFGEIWAPAGPSVTEEDPARPPGP